MVDVNGIISEVVKATSKEFNYSIDGVKSDITFLDGTWKYITDWLTIQDAAAETMDDRKYPLIALIRDFDITTDENDYPNAELLILVCSASELGMDMEQRKEVFKKVLHPISDIFIKQLKKHNQVIRNKQSFTIRESYHLGTDSKEQYKLPDILEGLFISNLSIQFQKPKTTNCITNKKII